MLKNHQIIMDHLVVNGLDHVLVIHLMLEYLQVLQLVIIVIIQNGQIIQMHLEMNYVVEKN